LEFESYVPSSLLDRVLTGRGDAPVAAPFKGMALFADITNYTDFAEQLCEQGPGGIERLARFLDQAFRRYVECIHATGGEVACFAGDALLAYWPEDQASSLHRAEECARLLHNASIIDTANRAESRTLHIGIGGGSLCAARVGGINGRWHLLLTGAAVRDAVTAAARASPGETLVGPAARLAAELTADTGTDAARGAVRERAPFKVDDFVPRVVKDWVAGGLQEWLPQLRSVCSVFVRIDGLDSDEPAAIDALQQAIRAALTAIQPYTGSSGTLLLDDKGLVLKLCLGLPHDSHVDDALRAVSAALAVGRELERLGLRCAAGIAAGRGVCMPVGGSARQHYVAVGRFMHVAARLMQQAGQGVLCTSEIGDRVRGEFTLSPEGRVELKGLRGSIRPFRVRDIARPAERAERLFGREFELKQLDAQLAGLARGKGRIVWLVGEAGIGKSALVRHFVQIARERGLDCWVGGAASVDTAVPYLAWRPVFAELLQPSPEARDPHGLLQRLRHDKLAPLVNAVLPGFTEETELVRNLPGDTRADAITRVLSEIVGLAAPAPLIVLEDCHWMDSASWRLLLRIAQDCPGALLVLSSRPNLESRELESLARLEGFLELPLGPLRKDAVAQLVVEMLEVEAASPELIDDVVVRSACNPLFVCEYARLLASTRRDSRADRGYAAQQDAGSMPATVEGLIASRLDALTPDQDLALKAASVLGDQFRTELLAGMTVPARNGPDLGTTLAGLVRSELLIDLATDGSTFAFRHALIRQGAYEQLTPSQREQLHRAAAAVIEERYAPELTPHVAQLAHHWFRAAEPGRAVGYADRAAAQALAAGAYVEADRLLELCLAEDRGGAADAAETPIRWLRQAAEARRGMGQLESRAAAARAALVRAGRARPRTQLVLALQAAARAAKLTARFVLPALRPRAPQPLMLEVARAYRHSANVCYYNNDMIGMICDGISAVDCAEAACAPAEIASASTELGGVLAIAGFQWPGERILRRAIEVAASAGDQAALAYAHLVSSLYSVGTGDWRAADRSAAFCQTLCEPMDDTVNWTNAQAIRYWVAHYQDDIDSAERAAIAIQDRAFETGNRQHQAWALRYLAQCALRREKPADAVVHLTAALDRLGETAALNERIPVTGLLALAILRSAEPWAARAKAREGLALLSQIKRPVGHAALEGYSGLAEVVFDAWRTDPAASNWRREARRCLDVLLKFRRAFPIGAARYWLWRGEYHQLVGRSHAASACYRRGSVAAEELDMPWDRAQCQRAASSLGG
jgi:class 3 adenylate cyclase